MEKSKVLKTVSSPGRSGVKGTVIDQLQFNNRDSFVPSPLSKTVLNDDTDIQEPRRESWWKNVDRSRDITEVLEERLVDANNIIEEFDIEVLSEEKKANYTLDLPESSGSESIGSIVVPQRKLFAHKENNPQKKFDQVISTRDTLPKLDKQHIEDKSTNAGTKTLFGHGARSKPIFPSALLNISPDKTIADKTKEFATEIDPPRSLFGRAGTKRKNMFADFIASESEDEIPEIKTRRFTFTKQPEPIRRKSSASRGGNSSPASSITTDLELDDWKCLPSSTMMEHQLEEAITPGRRTRLSKLMETRETINTTGTDNKSKQSDKSGVKNISNMSSPAKNAKSNEKVTENLSPPKNINRSQIKPADASKILQEPTQEVDRNKIDNLTHTMNNTGKHHNLDKNADKVEATNNKIDNLTHTINKSSTKQLTESKTGENADEMESTNNQFDSLTRTINKSSTKQLSESKTGENADEVEATSNQIDTLTRTINKSSTKQLTESKTGENADEMEATNNQFDSLTRTINKSSTKQLSETKTGENADEVEATNNQIDNITRTINKSSTKQLTESRTGENADEMEAINNQFDSLTRTINKSSTKQLSKTKTGENADEVEATDNQIDNLTRTINKSSTKQLSESKTGENADKLEAINNEFDNLTRSINKSSTKQLTESKTGENADEREATNNQIDNLTHTINKSSTKQLSETKTGEISKVNIETDKIDDLTRTLNKTKQLSRSNAEAVNEQDDMEIQLIDDLTRTLNKTKQASKNNVEAVNEEDDMKIQLTSIVGQVNDISNVLPLDNDEHITLTYDENEGDHMPIEADKTPEAQEATITKTDTTQKEKTLVSETPMVRKSKSVLSKVVNETPEDIIPEEDELQEDIEQDEDAVFKPSQELERSTNLKVIGEKETDIQDQEPKGDAQQNADNIKGKFDAVTVEQGEEVDHQTPAEDIEMDTDQPIESQTDHGIEDNEAEKQELDENDDEIEAENDNGQENEQSDLDILNDSKHDDEDISMEDADEEEEQGTDAEVEDNEQNEENKEIDDDEQIEELEVSQDIEEEEVNSEHEGIQGVEDEDQKLEELEEYQEIGDEDQQEEEMEVSQEIADEGNEEIENEDEEDDENDQETENEENEDDDNGQEIENEEQESQDIEPSEEQVMESSEQENSEIPGTPNASHDTTGRHRNKNLHTPEEVLLARAVHDDSFSRTQGRNTSIRKSILKRFSIQPSFAPPRDSTGLSDSTKSKNSTAEGSGWDSHRNERKTLRLTFGKDFTPRKSLRAMVMEKSAKRQTIIDAANADLGLHEPNSTEREPAYDHLDQQDDSGRDYEDDRTEPSEVEVSLRTRQTTLEQYLQKLRKENMEKKLKIEEKVRQSVMFAPSKVDLLNSKVPTKLTIRKPLNSLQAAPKVKRAKRTMLPLEDLPPELIEDMKYKPPKRFRASNAPWITKRLYNFLESKLEPKYDYQARIRAEKLVESIYTFARELRRLRVASAHSVSELKREMARLGIVQTHYEFYNFFNEFMPVEVRFKVVPDIVNNIPAPRGGVFSDIM